MHLLTELPHFEINYFARFVSSTDNGWYRQGVYITGQVDRTSDVGWRGHSLT